jgi:hypothetical protein
MIARTEANFLKIFALLALGAVGAVMLLAMFIAGPQRNRQVAKLVCAKGEQLDFELRSGDIAQLVVGVRVKEQRPCYYSLATCPNPSFGNLELRAYPNGHTGIWLAVKSHHNGVEFAYLDLQTHRFYNSHGVATSSSDSPDIESTHYSPASFPPLPAGLAPILDKAISE